MEKVNIFDAIGENKRNSLILIFLVMAIFLALIGVLSYVFNFGLWAEVIGFFVLAVYAVGAYFLGDKVILAISGAKLLKHEDNPFIYNIVEGLAIAAGIPVPKVYIIEEASPNAFATGRDPQHSAIAVTRGLLNTMNKQELEGVMAHEISHIANYDIRFSMLAVVLVGAIGLLSQMIVRIGIFGGGRRRDGGLLVIIGILFAILAPISAMLVQLAISRQREYLADANAAKLTRYPEGLAKALEKLKANPVPMQNVNEATASLYISDPLKKTAGLFATHPPIDERVKRLRSM
ncbi:MAG: M48 family metallopeptidase [Candidatus Micrarchaeota archaeon]